MKKLIILLILLVFVINVNAQELGLDEIEERISEVDIMPPAVPEMDDSYDVNLELFDYNSKEQIKEIHANIKLINLYSRESRETLKYVDETGILSENLEAGKYNIILKVDRIETDGNDFFIDFQMDVTKDVGRKVYLLPVGSVRGVVYDSRKNMIIGANIKFDCSGSYGELDNMKTDSFGSFTGNWLPVGSCRISAEYGNMVGHADVDIEEGKISDVKIELSNRLNKANYFYFVGILLVVVLVILFYNKKFAKKGKTKSEAGVSKRSDDIIKTLDQKEKSVVDYLLKNNNVSQAKISFSVGIAKTSLVRVLERLEKKKIIRIEKLGKLKKIELTKWFLEKE